MAQKVGEGKGGVVGSVAAMLGLPGGGEGEVVGRSEPGADYLIGEMQVFVDNGSKHF